VRETVAFTAQMLDAGYSMPVEDPVLAGIFRNTQIVQSKNIQYPGTSIQDQPIMAMVSIAIAWFEYTILCNYGVNSTTIRYQPPAPFSTANTFPLFTIARLALEHDLRCSVINFLLTREDPCPTVLYKV